MTSTKISAPDFPLDGIRRHKLVTAADMKRLPRIGATDGQGGDAVAHLKMFCPYGRFTFYVTEFDGEDTLYGYTLSSLGSDCDEWGYGSLSELANQTLPTGTPSIERDKWFTPASVDECRGVSPLGPIKERESDPGAASLRKLDSAKLVQTVEEYERQAPHFPGETGRLLKRCAAIGREELGRREKPTETHRDYCERYDELPEYDAEAETSGHHCDQCRQPMSLTESVFGHGVCTRCAEVNARAQVYGIAVMA